jgi:signal transduction histidine kinase
VEINAAQSRFISNVSHELRTPLFNIKSYVETLYDLGDLLSENNNKSFWALPMRKPIVSLGSSTTCSISPAWNRIGSGSWSR